MKRSNSLTKPRQETGEVVTVRSSEELVRHDQEFTERLNDRRRGLIRTFFPTKADKKIAEYEGKMVEQAAESKVEGYRMFLEFQRQAIKEALDGFLHEGKTRSRKNQTEFFEFHSRDLQQKVNDSTVGYFTDMEQRLVDLDKSTMRTTLRHRMERMLEQRMDEFETTITLLMARFASIPEEGV
jgi:hypothetical protein